MQLILFVGKEKTNAQMQIQFFPEIAELSCFHPVVGLPPTCQREPSLEIDPKKSNNQFVAGEVSNSGCIEDSPREPNSSQIQAILCSFSTLVGS
jgi:hypothetical protein